MTKRTHSPARRGSGGVTPGAALQASLAGGSAARGDLYEGYGLGSALIVAIVIAALGELTLFSRAGAGIGPVRAGSADLAARGREAAALSLAASMKE